jgi:hypothetical protein
MKVITMDVKTKIRLLDRLVDRYCESYLKTTKNGTCDGNCPFKDMCSTDYIRNHYRKIENIFESIKQKKLIEIREQMCKTEGT